MKPYLQGVTPYSVKVQIETNDMKPCQVQYKPLGLQSLADDEYAETVKSTDIVNTEANTFIHTVVINDLMPYSVYKYSVEGEYSATFRTLPLSNSTKEFTFVTYGDSRSNPKVFAKISNLLKAQNPDFSVYLGDLSFDGSYQKWKEEFFIKEQLDLASTVPFFNATGNHEGWKGNTIAFLEGVESKSGTESYYSFDAGDVHFLILNTQEKVTPNSPQWKFAEEDLKSSKAKWKIVAFHIPAYGAGAHGENKAMIKMTKEIFEPNGVDIVLNGHSHFYQHNKVNKIHHFILGGGGSPLYSPKEADYVIKSAKEYHIAKVVCKSKEILMSVIGLDGKLIDEISFTK